MAKTIKDRLLDRLPGTRTAVRDGKVPVTPVGLVERVAGFYQEWITEMKKVTWPGRKDTVASTGVVIVTVLVIVVFLGLVDFALGRITQSILSF
jgi:preprotein translocase subunit SecE